MNEPAEFDLPVEGGTLRVLRFGRGPRIALAAHGITGSGMSFRALARHLPDEWSLLAPDLRGRGGSADTPARTASTGTPWTCAVWPRTWAAAGRSP